MEEIRFCKKHGETLFVLRTDGCFRCKKCAVESVQKRRSNLKIMAVEYKGGKCKICGYDKCYDALEFHHLEPNKKDFGISTEGHTRSWVSVKKELDKCILVCANCHREIHHKEISDLPIQKENDIKIISNIKCSTNYGKKILSNIEYCSECGKKIGEKTKTGLCQKCYFKTTRKAERPSKEILKNLIENNSFTSLGLKFNVSDNTIRKWCKKYGLPYRKKDLK